MTLAQLLCKSLSLDRVLGGEGERVSLEDAEAQGNKEEGECEGGKGVAGEVAPEDVEGGLTGGHLVADIHQLLAWARVLVLLLVHPQILLEVLLCILGDLLLVQLEQLLKYLRANPSIYS